LKNGHGKLLELLEKSGATYYRLLTRLTLREEIAEELMQELFIKLSNTNDLNDVKNLNAYARRAAINLAFDWRRSQKRNALGLDRLNEPASNDNSPLAKLVQREELEEILNAIEQINTPAREVFVMRYIQQESYDDIAKQLGKTAHQARALCSRALGNVRDKLGSNQSGPSGKETQNVEN
jgi:RNA polymerase sigma-70 factor (ECF subfamily)